MQFKYELNFSSLTLLVSRTALTYSEKEASTEPLSFEYSASIPALTPESIPPPHSAMADGASVELVTLEGTKEQAPKRKHKIIGIILIIYYSIFSLYF
jgi:hypothetical protein